MESSNKLLVREHSSSKYTPRTYYNAQSADLTVAFAADLNTAGERCTHKAAGDKYIGFKITKNTNPFIVAKDLYLRLIQTENKTLNIAGNGIYTLAKYDIDQAWIDLFILAVISKVNKFCPIQKIYTGGQTGVDIAGAVVGYSLGIDTEVTLPKGCIQRFQDGVDVKGSLEDILVQIRGL